MKRRSCCYVDAPSAESEYELFPEDLDRLGPHIEAAIHRVPAFAEVGLKKIYNGAIAYTPDGGPIVGPAWDLKNFWLNEGHSFGVTAAGGAGWQLAEWIVEGEPSIDMMVSIRVGSAPTPRAAICARRTRRPTRPSSRSTIRTRNARRAAVKAIALLRPYEGQGRRFRHRVRLGTAGLVRTEGYGLDDKAWPGPRCC